MLNMEAGNCCLVQILYVSETVLTEYIIFVIKTSYTSSCVYSNFLYYFINLFVSYSNHHMYL